jgi:hypothetical protein
VTLHLTNTTAVRTLALPSPEGHFEAWEPAAAVDPEHPSHLAAAAIYPTTAGPRSSHIWLWRSTDLGKSWDGSRVVVAPFEETHDAAADPVLDFTGSGSVALASMALGERFGSSLMTGRTVVPGGIFLSRWNPGQGGLTPAALVAPNGWDPKVGVRIIPDKPAMIVDHGPRSRYRGSVYLTWGSNFLTKAADADLIARLEANYGATMVATAASKGFLAISRDGGVTFTAPHQVADSAFPVIVAAEPTGAVDVVYGNFGGPAGGHRLRAVRSTDGGERFGPPELVAEMPAERSVNLPVIATRPNGDVLVCWSEAGTTAGAVSNIRCSVRSGSGGWQGPSPVEPTLPPGASTGWPAVVGTGRGWYLLRYSMTPDELDVTLWGSADGKRFTKVATLAEARGIELGRFCRRLLAPCSPEARFEIGDYVSISAGGDRLFAAFTLPRAAGDVGSPGIFVSVIDEPGRSSR